MTVASRLASLLAPVDRAKFFAEYWDQRALFVQGAPEKLESIHFGLEDFFSWMRQVPKEGPPEIKAAYLDSRRDHQEMPIRPDEARELYGAGLTVCALRLHRLLPNLSRLVIRLIEELQREVAINCYVSPDGKGFGLHFDDHGVMILQLSGQKVWRHGATPCARFPPVNFIPLRTQTRIPDDLDAIDGSIPSLDALECSVLSPGDVLYLPPATWHQAMAIDHSVALTVSFAGPVGRDVVREALDSLLPPGGLPNFTPVVPAGLDEKARRDEVRAHFASWVERYKAAAEALDLEEVLATWSDKLHMALFHLDRVGKDGLFEELGLDLQRGAKIGLLGAHGSGKSTLLRIIAGIERDYSGKAFAEPDVRIGYLAVREGKSAKLSAGFIEDVDERAIAERRQLIEAGLGPTSTGELDDLRRILIDEPELLLLDDPTEGLDDRAASWLSRYLASYTGTVLAASRDRRFLDGFAGWILELSDRRGTPWLGNYSSWVEQKLALMPEDGEDRFRRALAAELGWIQREGKASAPTRKEGEPLLVVKGVSLPPLAGETREIRARTRLGVFLPKDAGARFIRILSGEEPPPSGRVRIAGNARIARIETRSSEGIDLPRDVDLILLDETRLDLDIDGKRLLETVLDEQDFAAVIVSDDRWLLSRVASEVLAADSD